MDIPAIVEALFGRKMTEPAAREMANEIRARCRDTTQAEVKAAFRALADRHGDQANRALPTAPEVAREVWAARKAPKQSDGESVEDGLIAIGDEPDPSCRWSMMVHRGQPEKLVETIKASGIEVAPWNKNNPHFGWAVALFQDRDYMQASRALFDEYEERSAGTTGRAKARIWDAHARKHWALFHATVAKREAEGWTPPAPAAQGPIMQAMVRQLDALLAG